MLDSIHHMTIKLFWTYFLWRVNLKIVSYVRMNVRFFPSLDNQIILKVSKSAKIRNQYNQVPHLTQDTLTMRHHKLEPRGQPFPSRWSRGTNKQMHEGVPNTIQKKT